jgi:hypothetical protein
MGPPIKGCPHLAALPGRAARALRRRVRHCWERRTLRVRTSLAGIGRPAGRSCPVRPASPAFRQEGSWNRTKLSTYPLNWGIRPPSTIGVHHLQAPISTISEFGPPCKTRQTHHLTICIYLRTGARSLTLLLVYIQVFLCAPDACMLRLAHTRKAVRDGEMVSSSYFAAFGAF